MRFAGYAAIFDRPDRGGDIIRKGAFANSLARGEGVPLLWQHNPGAVIGRIDDDRVILDLRTVPPDADDRLEGAVRTVLR